MGGILGGVVAIFDIRFEGRRFGSVEGKVVVQRLCRELRGEAELGDPRNRG